MLREGAARRQPAFAPERLGDRISQTPAVGHSQNEGSLPLQPWLPATQSCGAGPRPISVNLGPLAPGGAGPWPVQAGETACPTMAVNAVERAQLLTVAAQQRP